MFTCKWQNLKLFGRYLGQSLLVCTAAIFLTGTQGNAAEQITLISNGAEITLSIDDLQAFVSDRQTSEPLRHFFEQTSGNLEWIRQGLNARIPVNSASLEQNFSSSTDQFVLIQLDQLLGTHLRQENLEPLQSALVSAYADDQHFSVAELIEQYPAPQIYLEVSRLMQLYSEIQPFAAIANSFLPELACSCVVPSPSQFNWSQPSQAQSRVAHSIKRESDTGNTRCIGSDVTNQESHLKQNLANSVISSTSQELILIYGPLRPSFSVEDLEALAESGEAPRAWNIYLNVADVEPETLQTVLIQEVSLEAQLLDKILNSIMGEYVLFQIGQVIHTSSDRANIQALRAAMMQSVLDDNRISLLEFLQNYPLPQVYMSGSELIQLRRQFNQLTEVRVSNIEGRPAPSWDWLLGVQASTVQDPCECSPRNI